MEFDMNNHLKCCRCCAKQIESGKIKTVEISRSIERKFFELSRLTVSNYCFDPKLNAAIYVLADNV
jgi:hypothetical protein